MADAYFLGVDQFARALTRLVSAVEVATRATVVQAGHVVEAQAKINSTGPARWVRQGGRWVNRPRGGGPGVVTGSHRRSIHVEGPRKMPGGWTVWVGPSMVYSRALELGHPRWKRSGGYPYLAPALSFAQRVVFPTLWTKAWGRALATA